MEVVQIQLPLALVQRLRQEVASEEALQMWLERRRAEKVQQEASLRLLRNAGLAMDGARQRALADALMSSLSAGDMPGREQIEAILSQLKGPLSEEVMAMRGER
jgi:hypothetical protein